MEPGTLNIDYSFSKLSQSNLKGLFEDTCEHKCHTKYGSGSRSGHKRSRKVTRFKNSFSGMRHMLSSHFCSLNSKIEALLQSKPMQVNGLEGSCQPRVKKVKFSNWYLRIKNECLWTSLISGFQKCHFYFYAMSINAQNSCLGKMTSSTNTIFGLCVCQK